MVGVENFVVSAEMTDGGRQMLKVAGARSTERSCCPPAVIIGGPTSMLSGRSASRGPYLEL